MKRIEFHDREKAKIKEIKDILEREPSLITFIYGPINITKVAGIPITEKFIEYVFKVFAVSSDSLFIEKIYSDAMLEGRCDYLLVDDFDYEETIFLAEKNVLFVDTTRRTIRPQSRLDLLAMREVAR